MSFARLVLASLLMVSGFGMAQAQTAAMDSSGPAVSKRALRNQDRQHCTTRAQDHGVISRNQAEFIRDCMAQRQGERRDAAKRKALEERRMKREIAAEEWEAIQKVRNQERRQLLEKRAEKRAGCNRLANERKLRLKERRSFVKKCLAE